MSRRPDWSLYQPTAEEMEAATLDLIERGDEFLEWVSCEALADDLREPSRYFPEAGGISSVEMFRRAAAGDFTPEQCANVFKELVERFKDSRLEHIKDCATKAAIRAWPNDERARLEAV